MHKDDLVRYPPLWLAVGALVSFGCLNDYNPGAVGDTPVNSDGTIDGVSAQTDLPLRRLSRAEYRNSVRDVLAEIIPAEADAIFASLEAQLVRLPIDQRYGVPGDTHSGGFQRLDQAMQQSHVDAIYRTGEAIGKAFTQTPARISATVGVCATNADATDDAACVDAFIARLGRLVQRRPLSTADVAYYAGIANHAVTAPELVDAITALFASPHFVYQLEFGEPTEVAPGLVKLDAYELASRLSYHFWQTMPDQALFAAAETGELSTEAGYAAQIDRLLADPRAALVLDGFFTEWLRLYNVPGMNARVGDPQFDAFAGDDVPTADTTKHMVDEILDVTRWELTHGGSVSSLLSNRMSFAKDDDLARLYDMPVWNGAGAPSTFTDPQRAGLITRAALIATGTSQTRPIMKGVMVRTALLCDKVPPPPDNAAMVSVVPDGQSTTRELTEALTEQAGSQCAGCHALLNPLGYATEIFDGLGRARTTQKLYGTDGTLLGEKPVHADSVPRVRADDTTPTSGPSELTQRLVDSGRVDACFARQAFRFAFRRAENATTDQALIDRITKLATDKSSLKDIFRRVALEPAFRHRAIGGQ